MTITPGHGPAAGGTATYTGISPYAVRIISVVIAALTGLVRAWPDAARRPPGSQHSTGVAGEGAYRTGCFAWSWFRP